MCLRTKTNRVNHYALNTHRACRLVKETQSMQYSRSVKDPRHDLRAQMREIARTRVGYDDRRVHVLLKRDGWKVGKDQKYRLYREEQLQLRSTLPKRRRMVVMRRERIRPRSVSHQSGATPGRRTYGGRTESTGRTTTSAQVLVRRQRSRILPTSVGRGKPTDSCYVETFNGSLRDECLNVHWFETVEDARAIVEARRRDYNKTRPHMALNEVAPQVYARNLGTLNAEN